jgi:4-hydroxybenzoate polyprenyltransferase
VDLDGTLVSTDTLWESLLLLFKARPLALFLVPLWCLRGKAYLKRRVADHVLPNTASLPYRTEVLSWIEEEKEAGRPIMLVTAADERIAQAVQKRLELFDEVVGSNAERNLRGERKRDFLVERFGLGGFDYLGDSPADVPVWKAAKVALVVGGATATMRRMRQAGLEPVEVKGPDVSRLWASLKALRPHQWLKNLLLLIAPVLAYKWEGPQTLLEVGVAFLSFSLGASSGYVVNDLFDLEADRMHKTKRNRPFAAGHLSIPTGFLLALGAIAGALTLSLLVLPPLFAGFIGGYLLLTNAYSFLFKRKLIVDVVLLALLFTYRVLAGGVAVSVPVSFWLLAFSLFFFTGLAFAKRYSELVRWRDQGLEWVPGRSYGVADLPTVRSVGSASGLVAVMVFALYIHSPEVRVLYDRPEALWLVCPILLYWITRIWFLAARNELHDDPIVFAMKDRNSYLAGLAVAACVVAARW